MIENFVPRKIGLSVARNTIKMLSAFSALAVSCDKLRVKLFWVPFDKQGNSCLMEDSEHFSGLTCKTAKHARKGSHEIDPSEGFVEPKPSTQCFHLPVLLFREPCGTGYAAVNGFDGKLLRSTLSADPHAARIFYVFVLILSIFVAWMAAFAFDETMTITKFVHLGMFAQEPLAPYIFIGIHIAMIVTFLLWIKKVVPPAMNAALDYSNSERIGRFPVEVTTLLRWGAAAMLMISLFVIIGNFQRGSNIAFGFALLALALFFTHVSFKLGNDKKTNDKLGSGGNVTVPHALSNINDSTILVILYGLAAVIINNYLIFTGLITLSSHYNGGIIIESNFLEAQLVSLGIIVAVLKSKLGPDEKYPVAVGLLSEHVSELYLPSHLALLVPLLTVSLTVFIISRIKNERRDQLTVYSIKKAIRFNIGAAAGRIVGRVLGALLLGSSGIIIGEAISEQILGVYAISDKPDESEETSGTEGVPEPTHHISLNEFLR